jgi:hypothetical protein
MAKFTVNPKQLVTSALINRGRLPDSHLPIIAKCLDLRDDEKTAENAALGLVALGLVSGGVLLGAAAVGPLLALPAVSTVMGAFGYYNHPFRGRRRDEEAEFLRQNPQAIGLIAGKMAAGHNPDVIDAAFRECFTQWRSTGQRGLEALIEGHPAQTILDVPAAVEQPQPIAPGHHPIAPNQVTVPVSIHNHLGRERNGAAPKSASPSQSERRTEAPDLSLYPDVPERMTVLLRAMAESGFPLGSILKRPFVWCYGGSQSGKTTAAMLLSAARIAMGQQIEYLSVDRDVEPLKWSSLSLGPTDYADALKAQSDRIRSANKNELRGMGLCVDEMYAAHTEWGIDLGQVMGPLLEKGAKCKLLFIGISQQDTSGAHGLTNIDAAWRQTRSVLEAIHEFDQHGEPYPSGRYLYSHGGGPKEEWFLPEWMLGELNNYGDPCPVVWLLNRFPELRQGRTQPPPAPATAAPAWASMGAVQTPVQGGSNVVQGRFSGSGLESGSNHGSGSVQALNQRETGTFGALEVDGSRFMNRFEPAEPQPEPANSPQSFTNLNLNRSDAIDRVTALKGAGLNQGQIILALWGCPKGGSKGYTEALGEYKELTGE